MTTVLTILYNLINTFTVNTVRLISCKYCIVKLLSIRRIRINISNLILTINLTYSVEVLIRKPSQHVASQASCANVQIKWEYSILTIKFVYTYYLEPYFYIMSSNCIKILE